MPWKLEGEAVAMKDGNPIWVESDGREVAADYGHALNKISELTRETIARKEKIREAEDRLKAFEGIDDPGSALKALETMKNLDAKKLIDAGDAERVRAEAIRAVEAKREAAEAKAKRAEDALRREMIGGKFARSAFIKERMAIPVDLVEARFGSAFTVDDDGSVIALGPDGSKLFSRDRPGEPANFEEALATLIEAHPHKDWLLRGSDKTGSGTSGTQRVSGGVDLNKLSPVERLNHARQGGK
jgi:hypothetical protein